jgi:hypothetical protein
VPRMFACVFTLHVRPLAAGPIDRREMLSVWFRHPLCINRVGSIRQVQ